MLWDKLVSLLPLPILIAVGAILGTATVAKEFAGAKNYSSILKNRVFQIFSLVCVMIASAFMGYQYWAALTGPFAPNEKGVLVAQMNRDDAGETQQLVLDQLEQVIGADDKLQSVKIRKYNGLIDGSGEEPYRILKKLNATELVTADVFPKAGNAFFYTYWNGQRRPGIYKVPYPTISFPPNFVARLREALLPKDIQTANLKAQVDLLTSQNNLLKSEVIAKNSPASLSEPSLTVSADTPIRVPISKLEGPINYRNPSVKALVVGVQSYRSMPRLFTPANDAEVMQNLLSAQGAATQTVLDPTRAKLLESVDGFASTIKPDTIAIFYYSGAGGATDGRTVLSGVDTVLSSDRFYQSTVDIQHVFEAISAKNPLCALVILDTTIGELPPIPPNFAVMTAASKNQAVVDEADGHFSALTSALVTSMSGGTPVRATTGKYGIPELFQSVSTNVVVLTAGQVTPTLQSSNACKRAIFWPVELGKSFKPAHP